MFWNIYKAWFNCGNGFMNLKHEMFWNVKALVSLISASNMNLKHEMFWNYDTILPHYFLLYHEP